MKTIPLTHGKSALVDDSDFDLVNAYSWYCHKVENSEYARTCTQRDYKKTRMFMHRLIANPQESELIDHADGNGLNNQRSNLRVCNPSQNIAGKRMSKNNTSGFKGVYFEKEKGQFAAAIHHGPNFVHLGNFDNPADAALAYDLAAMKRFGEFARTNKSLGLL